MFEQHLSQLGFQNKEQLVYTTLIELGRAPAAVISKRTGLPRASVYGILDELSKKGVVSKESARSGTLFLVNSPQAFVRLVNEEKISLVAKERAAKQLAEELSPYIRSRQFGVPKIQLFEGKKSIENMLYDNLPQWRESCRRTKENTLWGYQDHTVVESYFRWHRYMWETRGDEETICLFSHIADVEKELQHKIVRREIRALPKGVQFSTSIWIYGEYIVMAITSEKPHYAFQMRDPLLSANLRTFFQLLWRARFD